MRGFALALAPVAAVATSASGIQLVIGELEKLSSTLVAEQKTDDKNYKDMQCWCMRTNRDQTAKKEAAEKLLEDSIAIITEKTGEIASLKAQVAALEKQVQKDEKAAATATKVRKKERATAADVQAELKDSISACARALEVLGKVTGSKNKAGTFLSTSTATSLVQIISENSHFRETMQKDLWDFLGQAAKKNDHGFLQQDPQPPAGANQVPADYENSSGKVYGMIDQMHVNFKEDLEQSLSEEAEKDKVFKGLIKDKTEAIATAKQQIAGCKEQKGEAEQALSNASADKKTATMELDSAIKILAHAKETCESAGAGHEERTKARSAETEACNKAIEILTSDKARALFAKRGLMFLQTDSLSKGVMNQRRKEAMTMLLTVGKRYGDVRLSALAMNTRYNFSELIATLKKLAEEKKVQKVAEIEKHDQCKSDLADNASQTQTQSYAQEDAEAEVAVAESDIAELAKAIEELNAAIKENNEEIGEATKQRKEENAAYVENLEDMKATKVIVEEALVVLSKMYETAEFAQVDAPAKRDPPRQSSYGQNQAGGAVVGLLNQLISSTEAEMKMVSKDEQKAQTDYETTVNELTEQNKIAAKSVNDKTESKARAVQAKADAEGQRDEAVEMLTQLKSQKEALHQKCDFLLKNQKQRQDALQGEIEALGMAVSTLQGARGLGF